MFEELLKQLPVDAKVTAVAVGAFLTAVLIEGPDGAKSCGLSSTIAEELHPNRGVPVEEAGRLEGLGLEQLAQLAFSNSPTEVSVGIAAVNAGLQLASGPLEKSLSPEWRGINAEQLIAQIGSGKRVALVGHFPFVSRLREKVGNLWVLELTPCEDDLPAEAAPEILPQADVLAMTSMTLVNQTFPELIRHKRPGAVALMLGPGTPLSPILFDYGLDYLSGAVVREPDPLLRALSQGANFRQVRRHTELVTMKA